EADGISPAPPSVVFIEVGGTGGGSFSTTTDPDGYFTFDRVPTGTATLTVDVLGNVDRARATADVPAGGVVNVVIPLNGVGSVTGRTLNSSGLPVAGDVSVQANGAIPFNSTFHTLSDGRFLFSQVPAGPFTLSL